jgi:hypothetical protein
MGHVAAVPCEKIGKWSGQTREINEIKQENLKK